jgi:hypothetical protein
MSSLNMALLKHINSTRRQDPWIWRIYEHCIGWNNLSVWDVLIYRNTKTKATKQIGKLLLKG